MTAFAKYSDTRTQKDVGTAEASPSSATQLPAAGRSFTTTTTTLTQTTTTTTTTTQRGEGSTSAGAADDEAAVPQQQRECPPDSQELGRATWTFLHTTAAYYPEKPTQGQQKLMRGMIDALAEFYACSYCVGHLRQEVQQRPPDVSSSSALSLWLCKLHNEVNQRLGKPVFDCSKVYERWKDGPADGSCD